MTRLISALVLAAPILVVLFFTPSAVFLCVVLLLVFRAGWEFQTLINLCGWRVRAWEGALDACAFVLAVWVGGFAGGGPRGDFVSRLSQGVFE